MGIEGDTSTNTNSYLFFAFLVIINPIFVFAMMVRPSAGYNTCKKLYDFFMFIAENNPLILDYSYEDVPEVAQIQEPIVDTNTKPEKVAPRYEDKYLEKFKKFPNEYSFTQDELDEQQKEYEIIKCRYEISRNLSIDRLKRGIKEIEEIEKCMTVDKDGNVSFVKDLKNDGFKKLMKFYELEDDDGDENDYDFNEMHEDLMSTKQKYLKELDELLVTAKSDECLRKEALNKIVDKKLDKLIDSYVLESTPLGNIYMRYNNFKKSFEYFSNSSMPYRYLEPVGRKYVTTFWCKPIFVDIDNELQQAEIRFDEQQKRLKELEEKAKTNPNRFLAKFKKNNTGSKEFATRPMKNRNDSKLSLPIQVKSNLPNVDVKPEKQLIKENANRYTWEGRLSNFNPLKKIDKKVVDKNLKMSFADFKKMQQQNKK